MHHEIEGENIMLVTQELSMQIDDLLEDAQKDLIALSKELDKEILNGQQRIIEAEQKLNYPNIDLLLERLTGILM